MYLAISWGFRVVTYKKVKNLTYDFTKIWRHSYFIFNYDNISFSVLLISTQSEKHENGLFFSFCEKLFVSWTPYFRYLPLMIWLFVKIIIDISNIWKVKPNTHFVFINIYQNIQFGWFSMKNLKHILGRYHGVSYNMSHRSRIITKNNMFFTWWVKSKCQIFTTV